MRRILLILLLCGPLGAATATVYLTQSIVSPFSTCLNNVGNCVSSSSYDPTYTLEKSKINTSVYNVSVALLDFDTSSIPASAVVSSVTLTLTSTGTVRVDGYGLYGEWYTGALDYSGYVVNVGSTAFTNIGFASFTDNTPKTITLSNPSSLVLGSHSTLRLGATPTVNPSGYNVMNLVGKGQTNEPYLTVTYTVTGRPRLIVVTEE